MCGIYKITNTINHKCYIGQSINIKKRWRNHKNDAFNTKAVWYNCPLYQAFRKYGLENFSFEVLEECEPFHLDEKETFYIAKFESFGPKGYNLTPGGQTINYEKLDPQIVALIINRLKTTEDTYTKIAEDFKVASTTVHHINNGKCYYDYNEKYPLREPLGKLAAYHNNCLVCGKIIEVRNTYCVKCSGKINNFKLRRAQRPDSIQLAKMIIDDGFVQTGKRFGVSDNAIKKWLKNDNIPCSKSELIDWYNKQTGAIPQTASTKKTIDEIVLPVKQIDKTTGKTINTFVSQADALRFLGVNNKNNHISQVCRGLRKSAFGFFWEYA